MTLLALQQLILGIQAGMMMTPMHGIPFKALIAALAPSSLLGHRFPFCQTLADSSNGTACITPTIPL